MTLEGAINLNETDSYIIYTMNSATTGQYGVVVPKNINGTINMLVDLHMKGSFDGVGSGTKTREQLVNEISEEYTKLKNRYSDGMLVMPMIDENMFQSAVINSDKQKMFDEVKKIGAITSELYKKLTESGVEKQKIDQKIIVVEKNQDDEKFVLWLKEQMPNFVDGIRYSELVGIQENVNPFASNNIFGTVNEIPKVEPEVASVPVSTPSVPVSTPSIFDVPASVPQVVPVQSEPIVSVPVVEQTSAPIVEPSNITSTSVQQVDNSVGADVDIFGIPKSVQGFPSNTVANSVTSQNSVIPEPAVAPVTPVVPEPTPVASSPLEGTITFNPIPNPTVDSSNVNVSENQEDGSGKGNTVEHASKGFANLIILVVVLIGVTIASIELGKFLYGVYGA